MAPTPYHARRDAVLWHVVGGNLDERWAPRVRWWHDNHRRAPSGIVVFQMLLAGRCVLRDADGDHEVGPGDAFLFAYDEDTAYGRPPDRPQWTGGDVALRTAHATLAGAGLVEHWRVLRARGGPVLRRLDRDAWLERIAALLGRLGAKTHADRRAGSPAVHAFVMDVMDEIENAAARDLGPVESALDELMRAPLSGGSLKAIAHRHGCAREHLTRVFAERVGMPPARWLRQARLQRALELLRISELPLAIVAAQAGFASTRTLARLVQRATGGTPGALRWSARAQRERARRRGGTTPKRSTR